jgi:glycosyltransferase involved in cell wall biosynthesis
MILNYYNDLAFRPSELFLGKDFGEVATVLGDIHGQEVTHLICCNELNDGLVSFAGNKVTQAEKRLRFLPRKFDFLKNLAVYRFLWAMRGKFSVLVMFPFWPSSDLLVARLFKAFNPGAQIIVKLDANLAHLESLQKAYAERSFNPWRQHVFYGRILRLADLVIHETREVGRLLTTAGFLGLDAPRKFLNIYNGVSAKRIASTGSRDPATTVRENVIIFSGRLSAPQKNVELIFRANPVPQGWKIRFLGRVDDAFRDIIESYRRSDFEFDLKYEFVGELNDKKTYYDELSKGKILLLCSIWEGFPMVYAEAHFFGLYIVTTDVSGAQEATDSGRFGSVVANNDPMALRAALYSACNDAHLDQAIALAAAYGKAHFVWEDSLRDEALERVFEGLDARARATTT